MYNQFTKFYLTDSDYQMVALLKTNTFLHIYFTNIYLIP